MKKKRLAAMLAAIIAAFTLAGCASSGNGSGTASSTDAGAGTQTAEETTEEATGSEAGSGNAASDSSGDASGEPIELNFLYYADDTQKEILNAAIEDYENDHPGITITQTVIPADGSISTTIATMASSNTLPDVSYMAEADVVKYADAGLLMSLDDAINDGTIGKKLDAVTIHGSDGKIYGLGCSNQLMICYYNKDLFDAAGVDYPAADISGAWDWDTFISSAKKLTVDSNGNHPDDSGFNADSVTQYGAAWSTMYQFYYM